MARARELVSRRSIPSGPAQGGIVRCREVMRRRLLAIHPDTPLAEAARRMRAEVTGFLPICSADHTVVGVVTDRDLALSACADGVPRSDVIASVMTTQLVTCGPDDALDVAIDLMRRWQVRRIVVVEPDGKLAGVLSLADIAQIEEPIRLARLVRDLTARESRARGQAG